MACRSSSLVITIDYGSARSSRLPRLPPRPQAGGMARTAALLPSTDRTRTDVDALAAPTSTRGHARRALLALLVAGASLAISTWVPLLGPLLVALVIGTAAANVPVVARHVVGTAPRLDKFLLRSGIVLLGLRVAAADVLALGVRGLAVVLLTVLATYTATQVAGRMKRNRRLRRPAEASGGLHSP